MSLVVVNRPTQKMFLKSRFEIFRCQKDLKKGYIGMRKKNYLEALKKCPESVHFPLLLFSNSRTGQARTPPPLHHSNYTPGIICWE